MFGVSMCSVAGVFDVCSVGSFSGMRFCRLRMMVAVSITLNGVNPEGQSADKDNVKVEIVFINYLMHGAIR